VSLEDELVQRHLSQSARRALELILPRDQPVISRLAWAGFKLAQRRAQALARQQRQSIMRSDLWLEQAFSFSGADTI